MTEKYAEIATGRGVEVKTSAGVIGFEDFADRGRGEDASGRFSGSLRGELRGAL